MIIDHKYGKIKVNPKTYHKDMIIASYHALNDYTFILNKIKDITPEFLKGKEVISKENPRNDKWLFKDKYGVFKMHITDILNNKSCPKCSPEYYSKNIAEKNKKDFKNKKAVLYLINIYNEKENFYKIGITINLHKRFKEIQKNYQYHPIKLIHTNLYDAIQKEDEILNSKTKKYIPKIKFGGYTECFLEQPSL